VQERAREFPRASANLRRSTGLGRKLDR
jgi:hypothetical protein